MTRFLTGNKLRRTNHYVLWGRLFGLIAQSCVDKNRTVPFLYTEGTGPWVLNQVKRLKCS